EQSRAHIERFAQRLTDNLQGRSDDRIVDRGPGPLLTFLDRSKIDSGVRHVMVSFPGASQVRAGDDRLRASAGYTWRAARLKAGAKGSRRDPVTGVRYIAVVIDGSMRRSCGVLT